MEREMYAKMAQQVGRRTLVARRRGISLKLALLYLILFTSLALAFYTSVSHAIAIGDNSAAGSNARMAAESGMEFVRVHLDGLKVTSGQDPAEVFEALHADLARRLEGTSNLHGRRVGLAGNVIQIPEGHDEYLVMDPAGARFRVEIERSLSGVGLKVKVVGKTASSDMTRTIHMDFDGHTDGGAVAYGAAGRRDRDKGLRGL